jgi:hypothetical protein
VASTLDPRGSTSRGSGSKYTHLLSLLPAGIAQRRKRLGVEISVLEPQTSQSGRRHEVQKAQVSDIAEYLTLSLAIFTPYAPKKHKYHRVV